MTQCRIAAIRAKDSNGSVLLSGVCVRDPDLIGAPAVMPALNFGGVCEKWPEPINSMRLTIAFAGGIA